MSANPRSKASSTTSPVASVAVAQEPKRERGHARVAAIMEAGLEVFMEKGFDKTTMTEIAARSNTAIGSLYRFFPNKETLADALLQRYGEQLVQALHELQQQAADMTPDAMANALVDFVMELRSRHSFRIALTDARGGSDEKRRQFRVAIRQGFANMLQCVAPKLSAARARGKAVVLVHLLKAILGVAEEEPALRLVAQTEIRELVKLYLEAMSREDTSQ